jgi:hypothetical protein
MKSVFVGGLVVLVLSISTSEGRNNRRRAGAATWLGSLPVYTTAW